MNMNIIIFEFSSPPPPLLEGYWGGPPPPPPRGILGWCLLRVSLFIIIVVAFPLAFNIPPYQHFVHQPNMATSVEMKIKILKKSMSTFGVWLDSCDQLIKELPQELENSDPSHLRELALKYKVHIHCIAGNLCMEKFLWG